MKSTSYWLDTPYTPRPPLRRDAEADVAVVGGGITGVSVAYHCARLGLRTILIEKDAIASGSAGKNGGMVVDGLDADFIELRKMFGVAEARALWTRTIEARKHVEALIRMERIDCDFSRPGSLYLGFTAGHARSLEQEARTRERYGIRCRMIASGRQLHPDPFSAALYNREDAMLHPVKFVRGLAEAAERRGAVLYEKTPALRYDGRSVTTPKGIVRAENVVLALEADDPNLSDHRARVVWSQAIVTRGLSDAKIAEMGRRHGGMFWTFGKNYVSGRWIGNRLFACASASPESSLLKCFPTLRPKDIIISHRWSGRMVHRRALRPHIGHERGYHEIFGHSGNGLTFGILCGKLLAESFKGQPIPEVFAR